jgi:hypothetical protein
VPAHVHDCINQYEVTLNAIVNAEWKAIDEVMSHISFNDLPSFRVSKDALYTRFDGLDEGFG